MGKNILQRVYLLLLGIGSILFGIFALSNGGAGYAWLTYAPIGGGMIFIGFFIYMIITNQDVKNNEAKEKLKEAQYVAEIAPIIKRQERAVSHFDISPSMSTSKPIEISPPPFGKMKGTYQVWLNGKLIGELGNDSRTIQATTQSLQNYIYLVFTDKQSIQRKTVYCFFKVVSEQGTGKVFYYFDKNLWLVEEGKSSGLEGLSM